MISQQRESPPGQTAGLSTQQGLDGDLHRKYSAGGSAVNYQTAAYADKRLSVHTDPLQVLLSRLDGVQQSGNGWRARCPSCGGNSRKLSVSEGDDRRVLLHAFCGCPADDVVDAVGLTLADLFPEPIRDQSPLGKRQRREIMRAHAWGAALEVLAIEAGVIDIAANDLQKGRALGAADQTRLMQAIERIRSAREVLL